MEYEVPLENRVINAFIRRKQGFLVKAMQGAEYRRAAQKAIFDIKQLEQQYHSAGSNPEIKRLAESLADKLDDSFSGDVERHAMQYAHIAYISPAEHRVSFENLLPAVVAEPEAVERLEQANKRSYDAVCRNYYPIAALLAIGRIKGADFAVSEKAILSAVKTAFPSRDGFIAKETELVDAGAGYFQAVLSLNDVDGKQDDFYASAMQIIADNAIGQACKMAAVLEADGLYRGMY